MVITGERTHDGLGTIAFRQVLALSYRSFEHAQGSQPTQFHYVQAVARLLCQGGAAFDPLLLRGSSTSIRQRGLPADHMPIPPAQAAAQFDLWWRLACCVLESVYTQNPYGLPDRRTLDTWAGDAGGTPAMSSFTDQEMTALADTIGIYRSEAALRWTASAVVTDYFLPALIQVEAGFQGIGTAWPQRPSTSGDPHRSRMLGHCRAARRNFELGRPGPTDWIYALVCQALDLPCDDRTRRVNQEYRALIDLYNSNHPTAPVPRLHVPHQQFPAQAHARGPVDRARVGSR